MNVWLSWMNLSLNVVGCAIMVRYGLPRAFPFVGTDGSDPLLGVLGLMLFVTSLAIRVSFLLFLQP